MQDLPGAVPVLERLTTEEPADEPITLFAPNNEAFAAIEDVTADLSPEELLPVPAPPLLACLFSPMDACEADMASG